MAFKDRFLELDQVMGWRRIQWAMAAAWFESAYEWLPLPDLAGGAVRVSSGWYARRLDEPAEQTVLIPDYRGWLKPVLPSNDVWAVRMFIAVRNEAFPLLRPVVKQRNELWPSRPVLRPEPPICGLRGANDPAP